MVDWRSPAQIEQQNVAFAYLNHGLFGLYGWEWFLSLDFELALIRGDKRFRWPLVFYFANRYLTLFLMIGTVILVSSTTEINCQRLVEFAPIAGDSASGLASINLAIRTVAIWGHNRWVIIALVLVTLGHWSLILRGVRLNATWVEGAGCMITEAKSPVLAPIFIYSMCFDLLVLLMNTYKLRQLPRPPVLNIRLERLTRTRRLSKMLFEDGLIYFITAFIFNLVATVFMLLDLSQFMTIMFNIPAIVFCTIVACRAVRRLTNFDSTDDVELQLVVVNRLHWLFKLNRPLSTTLTSNRRAAPPAAAPFSGGNTARQAQVCISGPTIIAIQSNQANTSCHQKHNPLHDLVFRNADTIQSGDGCISEIDAVTENKGSVVKSRLT
ncbi:hypothetical protein FA15DRAFT_733721 [Coprinopsis marcescibilis]|uniref:Transmembrane protein n=1 Tax=Coprinopsis marcescibilis TaxID=230819 RepID=A0A5C3L0R3_COPMA|nr:hypothetical protein FA15DRAFT_733721 [Coprinopsis marcescibilis]